MLFSVATLAV